MTSLSRWLFRKALVPFVSARAGKQLRRWPVQAPRARLNAEGLENRDVAGSLIDGFLMAAAGGLSSEPLAVMAGAVGENALLAAAADAPPPLFVGIAAGPVAPPAGDGDPAVDPANPVAAADTVVPVGGDGWATLAFGGFAPGMFSFADGPFGGGVLPDWAGVSIGGDAPAQTHGESPSPVEGGGTSPASGGAEQPGSGDTSDPVAGPAPAGPLPNPSDPAATEPGDTSPDGSAPPPSETDGDEGGFGSLLGGGEGEEGGGGTSGGGEGGGTSGGGTGGGTGGGSGQGGYQSGPYDIVPDTTDIRKGEEVWFEVKLADGITDLTDETVEWDFDYDGTTFAPEAGYEDAWASYEFDTVGTRTVAARVTDAESNVEIVTEPITVGNPRPVVSADDMEVTQSVPFQFAVDIDGEAAITAIEWAFWSYETEEYEVDPDLTAENAADPWYWFDNYGDAWVRVRATDANGEVGEAEFYVWVANDAPDGTVTFTDQFGAVNPVIYEGDTVTFTIAELGKELDVDNTDSFDVYADFDGSGEFVMIDEWEWTYDATGQSISFAHTYDDNGKDNKAFAARIRVSDDWGYETEDGVSITVTNVAPSATVSAGQHIATLASSGQEVWAVRPGDQLKFENLVEPSDTDRASLQYFWEIDGVRVANADGPINAAVVALPAFKAGEVHDVVAYILDKDNDKSAVATFAIAAFPPNTPVFPFGQAEGTLEFTAPAADKVQDGSKTEDLALGFGPVVNGVYGEFTVGGTAPPSYQRFAQVPAVTVGMAAGEGIAPTFTFDAKSVAFANESKASVRYRVRVDVYDISQWSLWDDSYDLVSTTFTVTDGQSAGQPFAVNVGGLPQDRRVVVTILPELMKDGAVFRTAPAYQVIGSTPLSPTTVGTARDIWRIVRNVGAEFGSAAASLFSDLATGEAKFSTILNNLKHGLSEAVDLFFGGVKAGTTVPAPPQPLGLMGAFYNWLGDGSGALAGLANFDPTDPNHQLAFLLQFSGFNWDRIQGVLLDEFGNGNVAALTDFVDGVFGAGTPDPTDPLAMVSFFQTLSAKAADLAAEFGPAYSFDWATIRGQLIDGLTAQVGNALAGLIPQVVAMFVPGAGMVRALYRGLTWIVENRTQLEQVFTQIAQSLTTLTSPGHEAFRNAMVGVMNGAATVMVSFLASQFGLNKVRDGLRKVVSKVPLALEKGLRNVVRGFARKADGGTALKERNSSQTANKANGQATDVFTFGGTEYRLVVAGQSRGGTEIKIVEKATGKLVGEPLKEKHFTTAEAKQEFVAADTQTRGP